MPVVEAWRNVVRQTKKKKLQTVVASVADDVEGGMKLSHALDQHQKVFSSFFVNIIRSGETSGRLDEVLNYLADQLEKDYELNSKIKGALIYPAFILSFLVILGVIMMIFVVPRLTEMLLQTGAQLPLSTRLLIGVSDALRGYWWLMLVLVIGGIVLFRLWLNFFAGLWQFVALYLRGQVGSQSANAVGRWR